MVKAGKGVKEKKGSAAVDLDKITGWCIVLANTDTKWWTSSTPITVAPVFAGRGPSRPP